MSKGDREPDRYVIKRRFKLLLHLMRENATTEELHKIIRDAVSDDRHLTDKAVKRMFEEDKVHIKAWFDIDMHYNRAEKVYELRHIGRPLVDLSGDAVRGMAFLEQSFSDDSAPMGANVRAFLRTISMVLPYERLKEISRQRLLEMELGVQDTEKILPEVWEAIEISKGQHRQLQFDYISPQQKDNIPREKIVAPIRDFFDIVRKHYYLEAFAIHSYAPHKGHRPQNWAVRKFRMDRMSNPKVLPTHFNPNRRIPTQELVYELTANVARLDVTEHFPDMQVYRKDDGGAKVIVLSRDLFFDLRTLLHYGPNCRVIGGNDALYEMKRLIKDMAAVYEEDIEE